MLFVSNTKNSKTHCPNVRTEPWFRNDKYSKMTRNAEKVTFVQIRFAVTRKVGI